MKMTEDNEKQKAKAEGTGRIETLADGVFAIDMTLLVLTIQIPKIPDERVAVELPRYIYRLWPQLC